MKENRIFWTVDEVWRIFFPKKPRPESVSPYRVPATVLAGKTPDPARPAVIQVPWRKIVFSSVLVTTLVACLGVSSQDLNALQDAAKLNLAAYKHSDGGAERALERGAYCAVEGVLRRNGAAVPQVFILVDGGVDGGDGGVTVNVIQCNP